MTELMVPLSKLKTGTLANGLRYFVMPHNKPQHRAELRLIVQVGSLLETEQQRGMAHFVEHMGFKGTQMFPANSIVQFLESLGSGYGPDINASTNLFETVYKLSVKTDECSLDTLLNALLVLSEWAFRMNITKESVDSERKVIEEEWRGKQGPSQRLLNKYWSSVFKSNQDEQAFDNDTNLTSHEDISGSSVIGQRFPIGKMSTIMNSSETDLFDFYSKWYTPDRMALVVIGDFSTACSYAVENGRVASPDLATDYVLKTVIDEIVDRFGVPSASFSNVYSSLCQDLTGIHQFVQSKSADAIALNEPVYDSHYGSKQLYSVNWQPQDDWRFSLYPKHDDDVYCMMIDPEITHASFTIEFIWPYWPSPTRSFLKSEAVRRLLTSVIDARITLIAQDEPNSPFVSGGISLRPLVRGLSCFGVSAQSKTDSASMRASAKRLLIEMKRLHEHGINAEELELARLQWRHVFNERIQSGELKQTQESIVEELCEHFLHNCQTIMLNPRDEAEMSLNELNSLTMEDIRAELRFLDGHLLEQDSLIYYKSNKKSDCDNPKFASKSFRVIQCQCPSNAKHSTEEKDGVCESKSSAAFEMSDVDLKSMIAEIRTEILSMHVEPWQHDEKMMQLINLISNGLTSIDSQKTISLDAFTKAELSSIGATEYTLANGIKVCVKPSQFNPGIVSFQAFALGGSSEFDTEEEDVAMNALDECSSLSGLFYGMSGRNSKRLLSVTKTRVNTQRHMYHRGLGGSCPSNYLELMMQMIMTKLSPWHETCEMLPGSSKAPDQNRLEANQLRRLFTRELTHVRNKTNVPEHNLMERARILTCGGDHIPVTKPVTPEILERLIANTDECAVLARSVYYRSYVRDPTEFLFVMTGDVKLETLEPLLSRYFCRLSPQNLPSDVDKEFAYKSPSSCYWCSGKLSCGCCSGNVSQPWIKQTSANKPPPSAIPARFPEGIVKEVIHERESEKATVFIIWRVEFSQINVEEDFRKLTLMQLACRIGQTRLLKALREHEAGVYYVSLGVSREPLSCFGLVSMSFNCDPHRVDHLIEVSMRELEGLASFDDESSVSTESEIMIQQHNPNTQDNSYWQFWILDTYKTVLDCSRREKLDCDMGELVDRNVMLKSLKKPEIIKSFNARDIASVFAPNSSIFRLSNRVETILMPRNKSEI